MEKIALIGSKEFARQIREYAEETMIFKVVGYFDDYESKGKMVDGLPILGKTNEAERLYRQGKFEKIFLAAGYKDFKFRDEIFTKLKGKIPFANIIMPTAIIGKNVQMGEGVFVGSGAVVGSGTILGNNVFIHYGATIGHNNKIGHHTFISGRFVSAGYTTFGSRCFIGISTVVSDHVNICDDVWVGPGCVVIKDITESGKYMSNIKLYKIE